MGRARINDGTGVNVVNVTKYSNSLQVVGDYAGIGGVINFYQTALPADATIAAGSALFAARCSAGMAATSRIVISRVILTFIISTAFTTIGGGRRFSLYKGSGADPTGGITDTIVKKNTADDAISLGEARHCGGAGSLISTTGITWETAEIATMHVGNLQALKAYRTQYLEFDMASTHPLTLSPGEVIGLRNPVVLDPAGAGQYQLAMTLEFCEVANW